MEKTVHSKKHYSELGIDIFSIFELNATINEIQTAVKFNILKYAMRNKGSSQEDLEKIISYANWGIEQLKRNADEESK